MAKTTTAPVAKQPTKMELARKLYAEIVAKAAPEGKTHRGLFIERAESIGLSAKAANTYFQNIKAEHEGGEATSATQPAATLRKQLNKLQTVASELNKQINDLAKQVA